ncbi:MAG: type II secretion system protein GspG, partial [Gammaproteobacteria bacterium]
ILPAMIKAKSYTRSVAVPAKAPARFRFDDIIIILVVVAIGIFAVHHFMYANSDSALQAQAKSYLKGDVATALSNYKNDTGSYPSSRDGLKALVTEPNNASNWKGPYLSADAIKDPWNMPYQYSFPGRHNAVGQYDVWSMGPDKRAGTADDVGNW